ncbi:MAG: S4 domain-containing protein [Chromatiales bacterium]|jgi:ribosome-associated heat shock protein Hsp15
MTEQPSEAALRIDRWLWAARFFKTRSAAAEAVSGGKVHLNGQRIKPARSVRAGDTLEIRRGGMQMTVIVRGVLAQRRPAREAQLLYEETDQSRAMRERLAEQRRMLRGDTVAMAGRPNKRDRRELRRLSGKD